MDLSKLEGYDTALKVFEANVSPRYVALTNLENWANGRQYQGMPDWFSTEKPLYERAPCFVYLLARGSMESKVDLVLGEGKFPEITTSPGEGDPLDEAGSASTADQGALGKDDSKLVDAFLDRVAEQSGFRAAAREVLQHAQEVSSSPLIFGVRKGKLFCDTTKAQWCEPTLDIDGECTRLEIKYPYLDPYKDAWGKWAVRVRLFRRVIDETSDTTYKPADATPQGAEPETWVPDPTQVFQHGFGFCPVVWYPFMRGCSAVNQIDGHAPHALLLDEIRTLDFALSQRHRAALKAGDPQWTECGVPPGYSPTATGRAGAMPATPNGGPFTGEPTAHYAPHDGGKDQPARKKSPGDVWQYPDKDTKVALHVLPADALEAVSKHAGDCRIKLCEMLAFVPLDPDSISHVRQLSGKALQLLGRRERSRCDLIRDDFGQRCLKPSAQMLLRICAAFANGKQKGKLNLAGLSRVAPILSRFDGSELTLRLIWGDYDNPDAGEEQQIVAATAQAHGEGLITDRMAMQKLQTVYDIDSVDEAVESLQKEKQERQKSAMDAAAKMKAAAPDNAQPNPDGGAETPTDQPET